MPFDACDDTIFLRIVPVYNSACDMSSFTALLPTRISSIA